MARRQGACLCDLGKENGEMHQNTPQILTYYRLDATWRSRSTRASQLGNGEKEMMRTMEGVSSLQDDSRAAMVVMLLIWVLLGCRTTVRTSRALFGISSRLLLFISLEKEEIFVDIGSRLLSSRFSTSPTKTEPAFLGWFLLLCLRLRCNRRFGCRFGIPT